MQNHNWKSYKKWDTKKKKNMPCQIIKGKAPKKMDNPEKVEYALPNYNWKRLKKGEPKKGKICTVGVVKENIEPLYK